MKSPFVAAALLLGTAFAWQAAQAQPAVIPPPPSSGQIIAEQPPEAFPPAYAVVPPPAAYGYTTPPLMYRQPWHIEGYGSSMAPGYPPPPAAGADPDDE